MMSSATTTVLSSLPNDHAATLADLMQAVSFTRHAETAAKRARERADYELMAYLEGIGETSVHSDRGLTRSGRNGDCGSCGWSATRCGRMPPNTPPDLRTQARGQR